MPKKAGRAPAFLRFPTQESPVPHSFCGSYVDHMRRARAIESPAAQDRIKR